ncbi:MAG: ABC transporter ATP-binding protein [Paracoccus sp. (in: a-proteobacteria)]|uniref:ABC transporter ATP-binding protein n=1 Tax=Paracoccus sp. TaxID=267 RepID=UPI0026DEFC75|nr:ABC transporter ATP-binding protein [Paracoccus sp. (in: a-proteobacteria)]MDO5630881.1 ABC transporter ATP-binding protein [Paracoccus sp. (in: a-proteobacteria)]
MARVELHGISKSFGAHKVIHAVDLTIEHGEFIVLVGPSGCGKSTLLRLIAGLESVTAGRLDIDGQDMTTAPPVARGIGMVFQSYALYPHMTVAENMGFGMKIAGRPRREIAPRVAEVARLLQLDHLLDRKPKALSGGQRQRVAIGRTLVRNPPIFLFDEPLSNLDAALRGDMRVELSQLHARLGNTMIYVTHDQVEAMTLADRIVVMRDGNVEQVGTPLELFNHPANRFVAGFLGQPAMNFVSVQVAAGVVVLPGGARQALPDRAAAAVELGIRPEDVRVSDTPADLALSVDVVEQLGDETIAHGCLADGQKFVARLGKQHPVRAGEVVHLMPDTARLAAFDAAGQNLLADPGAGV